MHVNEQKILPSGVGSLKTVEIVEIRVTLTKADIEKLWLGKQLCMVTHPRDVSIRLHGTALILRVAEDNE